MTGLDVGIIAPTKMLKKYCIGDIHYCLPQLMAINQEYREFYLSKSSTGDVVILDTRKLGWKRQPEDYDMIKEVLGMFEPSLIILPSHMFNKGKTIEEAKRFLDVFKPKYVAGCLEGTSTEDIEECKKELEGLEIRVIALPSHIHKIYKGEKLKGSKIYIENHLNPAELDGLKGILVTSLPVRLGLEGRLLSDYTPTPPSLDFARKEDKFPYVVERNIKEIKEFYE